MCLPIGWYSEKRVRCYWQSAKINNDGVDRNKSVYIQWFCTRWNLVDGGLDLTLSQYLTYIGASPGTDVVVAALGTRYIFMNAYASWTLTRTHPCAVKNACARIHNVENIKAGNYDSFLASLSSPSWTCSATDGRAGSTKRRRFSRDRLKGMCTTVSSVSILIP